MSGRLICFLCELAGRPAGDRFTTADDKAGQSLMEEHVVEPHPAQRLARRGVLADGADFLDLPLTDWGAA